MNIQPVKYLQTDSRWAKLPYRVTGETATVGGSGCGPSAAAMIIETMTGQTYTPLDACNWSMAHGYKAKGAGTYYSYFVPQFAAFNIKCEQVNAKRVALAPGQTIHDYIRDKIHEGYYAIALMGPGLWTKGGHFIVVWWWDDVVHINDSASTKDARLNGDPALFKSQVVTYWLIDAREFNGGADWMDSYDKWKEYMTRYREEQSQLGVPDWAEASGEWDAATKAGITDGARPQDLANRAEIAAMCMRAVKSTDPDEQAKSNE